jgi:uncharacterized membrane protein YvlD (DUF360 family)
MRKFVFQFAACVAALWIAALVLPGVRAADYMITVLAGASLGVLYFILRPLARILLGVLNLVTLGLIGLLIDTALVYGVSMLFPEGFHVDGILWALAAAAIVDAARAVAGRAARKK